MSQYPRKIKIMEAIPWAYHRSGWHYPISYLEQLHVNYGVALYGWADRVLDGLANTGRIPQTITRPFVGFFHHTPYHKVPTNYVKKYGGYDLNTLLRSKSWKDSESNCLGIFVLSEYVANWLRPKTNVKVNVLIHPTETPDLMFSYDRFMANKHKKIICAGNWMRNYEAFFKLRVNGYAKWLLGADLPDEREYEYVCSLKLKVNDKQRHVGVMPFLSNEMYDELLSENVVFCDLFDASANNLVIECIARTTPIVVNPVGGTPEYLGRSYPLYFSNSKEAEEKLHDVDLLREAHEYLKALDIRPKLTGEYFLKAFVESEIYSTLPKSFKIL